MKNFIFISPNFPFTYYRFVVALKNNGFRVLGVGDTPYDSLYHELKEALTEYYYCNNMEDFNQEIDAVRYFENKYGHIDYLESNNEYWLERDAKLREIFNIDTGIRGNESNTYQYKSKMKARYEKAGCKVAKYILIDTYENALKFADEVGYPLFIKPDMGVGAEGDYKIQNIEDLQDFFNHKNPQITYICEQFVNGNIISFDGICDSKSNVIFADSECFPPSISDVLKQHLDVFYYCLPNVPEDVMEIGKKVIKAFEVKNRFFHLEFFRLTEDIEGLGKIGDIVGLETNMRPPGGYTPDLINFANSCDVYQIYADSMAFDENRQDMSHPKFFAAVAARRDDVQYFYSHEDICRTFRNELCWFDRYPDVFSGVMGNFFYMAKFKTEEDIELFHQYVNRKVNDKFIPEMIHHVSNNRYGEGYRIMDSRKQESKKTKENICDSHIDGA